MSKLTTKAEYRKALLLQRNTLSEKERIEKSNSIKDTLLGCTAYKNATTVFTYLSIKKEVDTIAIIQDALRKQKKVAIPKCSNNQMHFIEIQDLNHLVSTKFGLLEPKQGEVLIPTSQKDLILIPGLIFDQKGHRIGYGKGYYDRYLNLYPNAIKIAIAYDFQVLPEIPYDVHDKKPNVLISEKRIYKID